MVVRKYEFWFTQLLQRTILMHCRGWVVGMKAFKVGPTNFACLKMMINSDRHSAFTLLNFFKLTFCTFPTFDF